MTNQLVVPTYPEKNVEKLISTGSEQGEIAIQKCFQQVNNFTVFFRQACADRKIIQLPLTNSTLNTKEADLRHVLFAFSFLLVAGG